MDTLVYCRPRWANQSDSEAVALALQLKGVAHLLDSPSDHFSMVEPTEIARITHRVRQVTSELKAKQASPGVHRAPCLWLIATSPAAVEALSNAATIPDLLLQEMAKDLPIKLAAVGASSGKALAALFSNESVLVPPGAGDAKALLESGAGQFREADHALLLEAEGARDELQVGLPKMGLSVDRLTLYRRMPQPMVKLDHAKGSRLWLLISSSTQVEWAVSALNGQSVPLDEVVFLTHHPRIESRLKTLGQDLNVRCLPSLNAQEIVSQIKLAS
ncbi:MAG: Uroporphyrinogen-III synthase HemD [Pseudomonadota bacterium]|jgi:uroporphyrinogen-III synthase